MTRRRAVFDASVLIRAIVDESEVARDWLRAVARGELTALVPELIWAEIANALHLYVRSRRMRRAEAQEALVRLLQLPIESQRLAPLTLVALELAAKRRLTAYDAYYVALADAADAVLVTADRRLASSVDRAELVS